MYAFLVLGLVPGTNFQITFMVWIQVVEAFAMAFFLVKLGGHFIHAERQGLATAQPVRVELPAKLLHR